MKTNNHPQGLVRATLASWAAYDQGLTRQFQRLLHQILIFWELCHHGLHLSSSLLRSLQVPDWNYFIEHSTQPCKVGAPVFIDRYEMQGTERISDSS